MSDWYTLPISGVLEQLDSDSRQGLDSRAVRQRAIRHGPNELAVSRGRGPWSILWEQFSGALVILLIVAAGVSVYLGEITDAVVISAIIVLNAALGFVQDYRAEKAMAALQKLAVPNVTVRRDGVTREISARDLVPGDVVHLEVGNIVPADCRLLESTSLSTQEAVLTGESATVEKNTQPLPGNELPVADRCNSVYMGTVVTYGRGRAVVTEIAMQTELGRIASMLRSVSRESTPLQRRLARLGRTLAIAAVLIVSVVFVMGLLRGESARMMFMTALSMAVAAVPEGLPAVATVALAVGARRMFKRHALIRRLPAVETLGSVTVICSDKTGTLTQNRMSVSVVTLANDKATMTKIPVPDDDPDVSQRPGRSALRLLVAGGALCSDAVLESDGQAIGDPTEGAIVVAAAALGVEKEQLERAFPRSAEAPFDSERKRMSTVHELAPTGPGLPDSVISIRSSISAQDQGGRVTFTKGAVDSVIQVSSRVWVEDHAETLDDDWRARILATNDELARSGMRVLGVAFRTLVDLPLSGDKSDIEEELVFIGMLGLNDPPRLEVKEAVERCKKAGIRPVMITGDHPLTALQIARQLGIAGEGKEMTGADLASMTDEELESTVDDAAVYARVTPEHKLRIVQALEKRGQIVAMTGDGVNDAPALKQADIGVAMGITGTDVSKEASDMVLLDDNFATIVNAVEEGRTIYDNIRKFVKYTMTSNAGEIWVMVLAPFVGMPLPLLPLQILWINLVTDGLPGLALAVEPVERGAMCRPPRPPQESIFSRGLGVDTLWVGLLMGVISLGVGYWYWSPEDTEHAYWRTMVFTVLTLSQMGNALATRAERESLFRIGFFSNRILMASVALTFLLQLAVIYLPFLQGLFKTTALSAVDLTCCILVSTAVFWAVEARKWIGLRWNVATPQPGSGSAGDATGSRGESHDAAGRSTSRRRRP